MARRTKASQRHPELSATLRQTVEALRGESLQCPEGELIGSEDELLARHQVSRPTLRQAAALVAQEQLLQVRRGVKGGYIARRPTSRAVAHMAAIYLRTREAGLDELGHSMSPIRAELARLAAVNLDDSSRQAFQDFLQREAEGSAEGAGIRAFTKSEREFGQLLGAASRNHVLALFLDILHDLAANIPPERDMFLGRPDRVIAYRQQRSRLVEAILDGDPTVAELLANRSTELTRLWLAEDLSRPRAKAPAPQHDHA
jgi:GntR family transcriptional regulator, transcriptional repressor for pyruvate dehydrogenase complex